MIIGIFTDTYYPDVNGVSTASSTLYKALKQAGHTVYVVTSSKGRKVRIDDEFIIRIPGVTCKKLYGYKLAWIYNRKAYNILKKINFDVIHIQTEIGIGIFGVLLARKWNIPLVYTYHTMYNDYTYYVTGNKKRLDRGVKKLLAAVTRKFIDYTAASTTTSVKARNALKTYGVSKNVFVVPNGVDFSNFDKSKISAEEIYEFKRENGLEDKYILLSLGRVAKEKSIDLTLQGLKKYVTINPSSNVFLLIVGDGPDRERLEKITKDLDLQKFVKFVGKVDHTKTPFFYAISDLFIGSSTTETQGLTYNEAMSTECLVMSIYDFNLKSVIIDHETGFYYKDVNDFPKVLDEIINLPDTERARIIKNAKENNTKLFSIDTYAEKMTEVYKNAKRSLW